MRFLVVATLILLVPLAGANGAVLEVAEIGRIGPEDGRLTDAEIDPSGALVLVVGEGVSRSVWMVMHPPMQTVPWSFVARPRAISKRWHGTLAVEQRCWWDPKVQFGDTRRRMGP